MRSASPDRAVRRIRSPAGSAAVTAEEGGAAGAAAAARGFGGAGDAASAAAGIRRPARSQADKPTRVAEDRGATGGGYFELTSTDDLASTFTRVADELHHQYALGFTRPSSMARCTPDVRIAQAGLAARARRSYLAPPHGPDASRSCECPAN